MFFIVWFLFCFVGREEVSLHGDKISPCSLGWLGTYCTGYSQIQRDLPTSTHPITNVEVKDTRHHTWQINFSFSALKSSEATFNRVHKHLNVCFLIPVNRSSGVIPQGWSRYGWDADLPGNLEFPRFCHAKTRELESL